jgi:hypothetical protein
MRTITTCGLIITLAFILYILDINNKLKGLKKENIELKEVNKKCNLINKINLHNHKADSIRFSNLLTLHNK